MHSTRSRFRWGVCFSHTAHHSSQMPNGQCPVAAESQLEADVRFGIAPHPKLAVSLLASREQVKINTVTHLLRRPCGVGRVKHGMANPTKSEPDQKIDAAVALLMAVGRAMVEDEQAAGRRRSHGPIFRSCSPLQPIQTSGQNQRCLHAIAEAIPIRRHLGAGPADHQCIRH